MSKVSGGHILCLNQHGDSMDIVDAVTHLPIGQFALIQGLVKGVLTMMDSGLLLLYNEYLVWVIHPDTLELLYQTTNPGISKSSALLPDSRLAIVIDSRLPMLS